MRRCISEILSKEQNSVPASIHSAGHMNIIESFIQEDLWLGVNTVDSGKLPKTWPYDNTPFDYVRWDTDGGYPSSDPVQS